MRKITEFWKGIIVMAVVALVLAVAFGGYVYYANHPSFPAPVTISNPALAVTPSAGPSPTASPTPAMSQDQAERWRKAGVTAEGGHSVSVK